MNQKLWQAFFKEVDKRTFPGLYIRVYNDGERMLKTHDDLCFVHLQKTYDMDEPFAFVEESGPISELAFMLRQWLDEKNYYYELRSTSFKVVIRQEEFSALAKDNSEVERIVDVVLQVLKYEEKVAKSSTKFPKRF